MNKVKFISLIALTIMLVNFIPNASNGEKTNAKMSKGEKLERQMWKDMKTYNWQAVVRKMDPSFQSVHQDGARDRKEEMKLIKGLELGEYTLSDFKVTKSGSNLIVTYKVSVEETIDGKRTTSEPAMRLSVWRKTEEGWKWISHANLVPLKK